jgi:quinoprotein glucose dehydrogenase
MKLIKFGCLLSIVILYSCRQSPSSSKDYSGWRTYAGSKDGIRYSSNDQINKDNVPQLAVAWTFNSNDKDTGNRSQNQCNPIVVNGVLYGTTPRLKLFALDAATGRPKWIFDPVEDDTAAQKDPFAFFKVCRGVVYWEDEQKADKRIFYSVGPKTYAINALNGKKITAFGKNGFIDLAENLDRGSASNSFVAGTTPGIIYNDLLIVGTRLAESADAAPGHIRAYDVRTGKRRWIFHTIPHPGEVGYNSWPDKDAWKKLGGANNWAGMSLDEEKGIVYVPTGSVGGDFYGGFRKGTNLFGNSLIALEAATGKYLWHFQVVHHDLWDRDLPANPNLLTVEHDGKKIDAVAQITKHGYVFLFDRTNGHPIFPIKEVPVPTQGALPGEEPWPTQPIPTLPEPFARQQFTVNDLTNISSEAHAEMLEKFKQVRFGKMFDPPSKEGSWIFPGFDGGGEWGGAAADPETGILYIQSSELPWSLTMIDVPKNDNNDRSLKGMGKSVYNKYCLSCHGAELKGNGTSYPSIVHLEKKLNEEQVRKLIENGKNMMPAFRQILENEKGYLLAFILNLEEKKSATKQKGPTAPKEPGGAEADHLVAKKIILDEVPYTMTGYNRFLDKNGYPGIKPPWGTLNAVNLNTGKLLWKVPLGDYSELSKKGIAATGTEGYGGPLVTKGGLVFIAASRDAKLRAFDKKTGKVLWQGSLPVPGYATPATYFVNGKQYVVIACGGGKIGSKSGDAYVAFALPGN